MQLTFAIVDDDKDDLDNIDNIIQNYFHQQNIFIEKYTDPLKLPIQNFYDAIFLDIEMPSQSGLELAKLYSKQNPESLIIFITNQKELVYKACNIHPFDFVLKENIKDELPIVLDEIVYKLDQQTASVVFTSNGSIYNIAKSSIVYCECYNHTTYIHTDYQLEIKLNKQLSEVMKEIDSPNFMRINRSYLVNMDKVISLDKLTLTLSNHLSFQISRRKKPEISQYILERRSKK